MAFDQSENFLSDGRDPRHLASRLDLENVIEDQGQDELAQRRAEFALMQQRHRAMMDEMVAQKRSMFGRTPPEVSVNALALAVEEAHLSARLRAAQGKPDEKVADIRLFQPQIQGKEVVYQAEGQKKPSFMDDGKNIYVPGYQDDVALLASLQLAQMRWGMVKVTGNPEFQERVVQIAAEFDLKLANEDLARQVQLRRASPGTLSGPTDQERRAAEKLHDELDAAAPPVETQPVPAAATPAQGGQTDWMQLNTAPPGPGKAVMMNGTPPSAQTPDAQNAEVIEPYSEPAQPAVAQMPKAEFEQAVDAEVRQLKAQGYDKAAISARGPEIEDQVRATWTEQQQAPATASKQPEAPEKSWIEKLKEERLTKLGATEGREADVDHAQIEDDEPPENAVDLGYGDDDDGFSVDVPSTPPAARPEARKTASVDVRP